MSDIQAELLTEQREATELLIENFGRPIALVRLTRTSDGAGGIGKISETVLPEVRRYFGAITRDNDELASVQEGDITVQRFVLIGLPEDEILKDDHFFLEDARFDVKWIDQDTRVYQCKALVERVM